MKRNEQNVISIQGQQFKVFKKPQVLKCSGINGICHLMHLSVSSYQEDQ